jgi:hypothetical protein
MVDGSSCEFESLTSDAIYGRAHGPLDLSDSNSDSQLERVQASPEVQNQLGNGIHASRCSLKFISSSDCIRKANEFAAYLRDAGNSKFLVERRTEMSARARSDCIRDENSMKSILRLHVSVQSKTIVCKDTNSIVASGEDHDLLGGSRTSTQLSHQQASVPEVYAP